MCLVETGAEKTVHHSIYAPRTLAERMLGASALYNYAAVPLRDTCNLIRCLQFFGITRAFSHCAASRETKHLDR